MLCWALPVAVYKKAKVPNLQRTQIERVIKIPRIFKNPQYPKYLIKKFHWPKIVQKPQSIYKEMNGIRTMQIELDDYEKDTMVETLQYRIENDEHLLINASVKDDLQDLLDKFLEDEYL